MEKIIKKIQNHFNKPVIICSVNWAKLHVKEISWKNIDFLHEFQDVKIKRSGTGMSLLIKIK